MSKLGRILQMTEKELSHWPGNTELDDDEGSEPVEWREPATTQRFGKGGCDG